jgi:hypothetical protein
VSDSFDPRAERSLRDALQAEVETVPVLLQPSELETRWAGRRRAGSVRRMQFVAIGVIAAVVALGATWSIIPHGSAAADLTAPPAGPVRAAPRVFPTGPGLSTGRASLTLSEPHKIGSSFQIGCTWSLSGHVLGLAIGKQQIGNDMPYVRWQTIPGPRYQVELVEADQSTYVGSPESYKSQATADGHSGTITFTKLMLNSAASTPPRSGSFTWDCDNATALGVAGPSLPAPVVDDQGIPVLWILRNGQPERRAFTGCPTTLDSPAGSVASSCATSDWWQSPQLLDPALKTNFGDRLAFALGGWTVTRSEVWAVKSSSPGGTVANPEESLDPVLGNGAVAFSAPGTGSWFVHFIVEASKDDGSSLRAECASLITVP